MIDSTAGGSVARDAAPQPRWLAAALRATTIDMNAAPIRIVDVGAAGAPPANQAQLASVSTYLGFDPDLRLPQTGNAFGFLQHSLINRAVTPQAQDNVVFNLTKYPECSSVLTPDPAETGRYAIGDFFSLVGQARVPAITLDAALAQAGLAAIDWLKLDTQGTDFDILASLRAETFDRLLVVDVEPGVTSFYRGENTVFALHDHMMKQGFWLADLSQQRFPRISVETVQSLGLTGPDVALLDRNPFALELRYCRTIEHMESGRFTERDFFALWVIAMANGHTAYAIEVAASAQRHGLPATVCTGLVDATLSHCRKNTPAPPKNTVERLVELAMPPVAIKILRRLNRWVSGTDS